MARLDRLGAAKEVAQIGALLGREFSYEALKAVAGWSEDRLRDALDRLKGAELIFGRRASSRMSFIFKHALVQDAAYSSLLRGQRRQLHERAAKVLEDQFPETASTQPELLAHHYAQAGLVDRAIHYWQKAGEHALRRSATVEAIQHLRRGIEMIPLLPSGAERNRSELALSLVLGQATWAVKGYGPETWQVYWRARDLLDQTATIGEHMTVLVGLWRVKMHRSELHAARELMEQCLTLVMRHENPGMSGHANRLMGMTLCFMGMFSEARSCLVRAIDFYSAGEESVTPLTVFGTDHALSILSMTLWALGHPKQAIAASTQSLARARCVGHAVALGVAKVLAALFDAECGNHPQQSADDAAVYCVEHGVKMYVPWARFNQGIALARSGELRVGIQLMQDAMASAKEINADLFRPMHLGYLASAYASLGQPDVGLDLLREAIERVEATEERLFEAELHRRRGELLLQSGRTVDAESALHSALAVARNQQARMWELRAAASLARYWGECGQRKEGRDLLAPIYHWFVDGADIQDLGDAKTLLDQLSCPTGRLC
jgi:tetratricopeptide (TPR) repeat protein